MNTILNPIRKTTERGIFLMNRSETKEKGKAFILALAVFVIASMCQMFSMIKSGFLGAYNAEVCISFLALSAFICIVFRIFRTDSAVYTASFTSVLMFANWSQLMLHYTCKSDETDDILKKVISFMIYIAFAIVAICVFFIIFSKIKQFRKLCLCIFAVAAIGISAYVFLFSADDSNTSTTSGGMQPAILMMFVMLYAFAGATAGNHEKTTRCIYLILFWLMTGSLVLKHETGIPVMTIATCLIMYFFFSKSKKEKWFIATNIIIAVLGVIVVVKYKPSVMEDTLGKVSERFNTNEHWLQAEANLKASSLFGSESYDVFLNESSSDYALNVNTHYWGFIWLAVMMLSFFIMSISLYRNIISNSNDNIISNLRKLSYIAICINVIYNILFNICGAPVIGVQMIGCGISGSIALLTGLLIGSVIAEPQKMKSAVLLFLEKTGVIKAV